MTKKRQILLATTLLAVIAGLGWLMIASGPGEPLYEGKPVSYWVSHLKNASPGMDSNAVPFLAKALETRDGPLNRAYQELWDRSPSRLQNCLPAPVAAVNVRREAVYKLHDLENAARPAVPALIRAMLGDEDVYVRMNAAITLCRFARIEPRVQEALDAALKDKSTNEARSVGNALEQYDMEGAANEGLK